MWEGAFLKYKLLKGLLCPDSNTFDKRQVCPIMHPGENVSILSVLYDINFLRIRFPHFL